MHACITLYIMKQLLPKCPDGVNVAASHTLQSRNSALQFFAALGAGHITPPFVYVNTTNFSGTDEVNLLHVVYQNPHIIITSRFNNSTTTNMQIIISYLRWGWADKSVISAMVRVSSFAYPLRSGAADVRPVSLETNLDKHPIIRWFECMDVCILSRQPLCLPVEVVLPCLCLLIKVYMGSRGGIEV